MQHHNYSLHEIERMIPWEKEIYVSMLVEFLKEENVTNKILIFGVSFLIFLYIFFNIGMVTGLIPVVGAPLPFISNGGTSLITIFIGLGIVQSIRVSRNV